MLGGGGRGRPGRYSRRWVYAASVTSCQVLGGASGQRELPGEGSGAARRRVRTGGGRRGLALGATDVGRDRGLEGLRAGRQDRLLEEDGSAVLLHRAGGQPSPGQRT